MSGGGTLLAVLLIVFAVVVFLGILIAASRSARRGRRYIGTDDPIGQYENTVDGAWAQPWSAWWPRVGAFSFRNWRQRVILQSRLDAERHEEERRDARERRRRDEEDA